MHNSVNHRTFERNWRFQVPPGSMFLRVAPPPAWARALRTRPIVAAATLQPFWLNALRRLKERASPRGSVAVVESFLKLDGRADVLGFRALDRWVLTRCLSLSLTRLGDSHN